MDERLIVAAFILLLLGLSLLVLVIEFATAYVLPAAILYTLIAAVLVWRVLTKG